MIFTDTSFTFRIIMKWVVFFLILDTFFALSFWSLLGGTLHFHLISSNCIGFCILTFGAFGQIISKKASPLVRFLTIFFFANAGSAAGEILAPTLLGTGFLLYQQFAFLMVINVMIAIIVLGFISYWEGIAVTNSRIREEQKKRLDMEKTVVQNQLKLIQARIEPRFLFDTLNRVLELLDSAPEKAKAVQLALIQYLRFSLFSFKKEVHPLSREMELIDAYLYILGAQNSENLHYRMKVDEARQDLPVPAMLLHSLVEKITSLDPPRPGDSALEIHCRGNYDKLRFEAIRSGFGNRVNGDILNGFDDIEQRVNECFGDNGMFLLKNNEAGSLQAIMEFVPNHPSAAGAGSTRPNEPLAADSAICTHAPEPV